MVVVVVIIIIIIIHNNNNNNNNNTSYSTIITKTRTILRGNMERVTHGAGVCIYVYVLVEHVMCVTQHSNPNTIRENFPRQDAWPNWL